MSDTYFPEGAVFVMLLLILVINPLLKLLPNKKIYLDTRQLALIFGMLLMACTVPTQGLLRQFPLALANSTQKANANVQMAAIHQEMDLPPSLFPDEISPGKETPNSTNLLEELPEGETIPWGAWVGPLFSWGALFTALWMMMIGLGMIVFPQWKDNERLPFPILALEHELIGDITPERRIPGIFRDKLFWFGAGLVLFLYCLNGLNVFTENKVPEFPLGWNLNDAFSEEPWRHMSHRIKSVNKLYFMLIGIAYFMPNRISFSIWFTTLAYGVYEMLDKTYAPPYDNQMSAMHRHGASIAIGLMVLYTGRHYWAKVFRSMVNKVQDDVDSRNRKAGWFFVLGCLGVVVWLVWAGVGPLWAMALCFICFITSIVISRIVAETGLPFIRITAAQPTWLVGIMPASLITATTMFLSGFLMIFITLGSRISAAAMMPHAMGMDKDASPKEQSRLPFIMLGVLIIGLVIAGAVTLTIGYENYSSLDGRAPTATAWGARVMNGTENSILALSRDAHRPITGTKVGQVLFGGALALGLTFACLASAAWPLHPIGLLMAESFYADLGWASIMIGWVLKTLVLRYGGATTYKKLKNLFIGLILGELFSAVIWLSVPVILILLGNDPEQVKAFNLLPP